MANRWNLEPRAYWLDSAKTLSVMEAQFVAAAVRILIRAPKGSELVDRLYGATVLREATARKALGIVENGLRGY